MMSDETNGEELGRRIRQQDETRQFRLKQLDKTVFQFSELPSMRQVAWDHALKFLQSTLSKVFATKDLPLNYEDREVFSPQLFGTNRTAGPIFFSTPAESTPAVRDDRLFIEDIYHIIYQIWETAVEEKSLLEEKLRVALVIAKRKSETSESNQKAAWQQRVEELSALLETLKTEIESLRSEFEHYSFQNGTQLFSRKDGDHYLELRETHAESGGFRQAIEELAHFVDGLRVEAAIPVKRLPWEVKEEEVEEEIPEEEPTKAAPLAASPEAPTSEAPEAPGESGGVEPSEEPPEEEEEPRDPNQPRNTPPRPPRPPGTPPPGSPPPLGAPPGGTTPDYAAQAVNNLKIITLETERLTWQYLNKLANNYDLPPETLLSRNPIFKEVVRDGIREWLMRQAAADKLDALYVPGQIRGRQQLFLDAAEHLKTLFEHNKGFQLFSDVLVERFESLKSDPPAQAAFKKDLESGKFADLQRWENVHTEFAEHFLEPSAETAVNIQIPSALKAVIKGPHSALGSQLAELGIADLNVNDNPHMFNERLNNIVNLIDLMAFGDKPPLFLSAVGKNHFQSIFKNISLTDKQFQELVPILQTYWEARVQYFANNGERIRYIGEGLHPNDIMEWFKAIPQQDAEAFKAFYLSRLEHFAEQTSELGGLHRVIFNLAGKKIDPTIDPNTLSADEIAASTKKESNEKRIKLQLMRETLVFTFNQIPDDAKRVIYSQFDPDGSQTEEWIRTGFIPDLSFDALDAVMGHESMTDFMRPGAIADEIIYNGQSFPDTYGGDTPIGYAAKQAYNQTSALGKRFSQLRNFIQRKQRKIAREAARKTVEEGTKAGAITALNAAGQAIGITGLGTFLVNIWYALPKELREALAIVLGAIAAFIAAIAAFLAAFLTGQAIAAIVNWAGSAGSWLKNLLGNNGSGTQFNSLLNPQSSSPAAAKTAAPAKLSTSAKVVKAVSGIHPATQAIMIATGTTAGAVLFNYMVVSNAFLADFPLPNTNQLTNEKISKYLTIEKQIVFPTSPAGCDLATMKCENLADNSKYEITYNIIITSKSSATVSITHVKDELITKFGKKKYEEKKLPTPPNKVKQKLLIPLNEAGSKSDFPELSPDPDDEKNIIRPGESVTITYTESFDSTYNDSGTANTFRADFYYVDGADSGNDYVQTGKQFCIGSCEQSLGCWPATGMDLQGPFEKCPTCTHSVVDAFDIMDPHAPANAAALTKLGVNMSKISDPTKIYSPFNGQACFPSYHEVYGNYVILTTGEWSYWLGHMQSRIQDTGCKQVEAGEVLGLMGNTGTPGMAVHSHFELRTKDGSVNVGSDLLGPQMPPSLQGNQPPKGNLTTHVVDYVLSCYDQE